MSTPKHVMDMSDEEIAALPASAQLEGASEQAQAAHPTGDDPESTGYQPPEVSAAATTDGTPSTETPAPAEQQNDSGAKPEGEQNPQGSATPPPASVQNHSVAGEVPAAATQTPPAGEAKPGETKPEAKPGEQTPPAGEAPKEPDYAAIGKALMQPIKANGREIKLQNAEEAIRMIQMGANYTKKLQELQPALRVVKMLQNNDLMDESKVSFLIDLSQRNPQAIAKLLKDGDIEPMSLDSSSADSYTPGNHQVTDLQVNFDHALDELVNQDGGRELLQEVMGQWDSASKQAIYQEPVILQHLVRQRSDGTYQTIMTEVDRLRLLGQIPADTPFIQAYRAVGDMLHAQGRLGPPPAPKTETTPAQVPTETRVETPAAPVVRGNGNAAATPRAAATPPAGGAPVNYLEQSDEEFLKQWRGRL